MPGGRPSGRSRGLNPVAEWKNRRISGTILSNQGLKSDAQTSRGKASGRGRGSVYLSLPASGNPLYFVKGGYWEGWLETSEGTEGVRPDQRRFDQCRSVDLILAHLVKLMKKHKKVMLSPLCLYVPLFYPFQNHFAQKLLLLSPNPKDELSPSCTERAPSDGAACRLEQNYCGS